MEKRCWFKDWFDSPYYHLLYNKRDEREASNFISTLSDALRLPQGARIWDLACGKGRHALALAEKGFRVTGTDLSENSIREAQKHASDTLDFFVHDMRDPFRVNYFDAVVNLFTSIGYFENERDNLKVFRNAYQALKPGGFFIVDFMNSEKVRRSLQPEYTEERGPIQFKIEKQINGKVIHKKIKFEHEDRMHHFEESVMLLTREDFEQYAVESGFHIEKIAGDYALRSFDDLLSDRLIMIFKK